MFKFPENNARFSWTRHIKNKMVFYNISGAQIMRIFSRPDRREEGIAPSTIAAMKSRKINSLSLRGRPSGRGNPASMSFRPKSRNPVVEEIWIMYKINNSRLQISDFRRTKREFSKSIISNLKSKITLISAWRYPGKTKPGERPKVPNEIMEELTAEGLI